MRILISILAMVLVVSCGDKDSAAEVQQGPAGPQGPAGAAGLTATSNKRLASYGTDMCTEYLGEACFFGGGQRITFNDGSVFVFANYTFVYAQGGDTDSDQNSVSFVLPPNVSATWTVLSELVARGAGYRRLFLVYEKSPEVIKLVHDTDNDGVASAGDTELTTVSVVDW